MTQYNKGDLVEVTFRARVNCDSTRGHGTLLLSHEVTGNYLEIPAHKLKNYEITVVEKAEQPMPAEWPPKVGDVWVSGWCDRDNEYTWLCLEEGKLRAVYKGGGEIEDTPWPFSEWEKSLGSGINPRLIHRA